MQLRKQYIYAYAELRLSIYARNDTCPKVLWNSVRVGKQLPGCLRAALAVLAHEGPGQSHEDVTCHLLYGAILRAVVLQTQAGPALMDLRGRSYYPVVAPAAVAVSYTMAVPEAALAGTVYLATS
ncbi:UNVERIFIED_CONTAM: hypothetical protein FKN15_006660 [Acipenser sinensis]